MFYLQVNTCAEHKNSLDLNIEKLQRHKRATSLKICENNISFTQ